MVFELKMLKYSYVRDDKISCLFGFNATCLGQFQKNICFLSPALRKKQVTWLA